MAPHGIGYWRPLVPADEFGTAVAGALDLLLKREPLQNLGAYVEFGVSRGTSMACVARALDAKGAGHVQLVGFDSFEGMPPEAAREGWTPGAFRSTLSATRRYLASQGVAPDRVELVKGWFRETLTPATSARLGLTKVSLVMYDCDTYSATKQALEFSLPLIQETAVVIFDDWGEQEQKGEIGQLEAFQECIANPGVFDAAPMQAYGWRPRMFHLTRRAEPGGERVQL